MAEARRALVPRITKHSLADEERAFFAAISAGRETRFVRVQDLDRYAERWRDLVPDDPQLKAALAGLVLEKYRVPAGAGRLRAALGLDDPAVDAAYERQHASRPAAALAHGLPLRERLRWFRSRFADRIDRLPPFWIAYALTLTETVGGGILALPIVLAGVGPVSALVLVVAFGLVNVLTVAALSEAIIRNGHMRYGAAYFGRLVSDYLGRPGLFGLSIALTVFLSAVFVMAMVGFGDVLGVATGIHAAIWTAGLFAIAMLVLARGALGATVASAIVIGSISLVLLLAIAAIALTSVPVPAATDAVAEGAPSNGGPDSSTLALAFGVLLSVYFGHLSAGNAAKVVLARDPGGRSLLWGCVLAMISAIAVYAVVTWAIFSAVDERALVGIRGTVITPLGEAVGPVIYVLGAAYASLALGLSSLHFTLGLYNFAGEAIHALATRLGDARQAVLSVGPVGFLVRASPVIAVFVLIEVLLLSGTANFAGPLGIAGTLTLPMVSGIFPVLMVAAARRRGDRLPQTFIGLVGRAPVIGALWLVYVAGILLHAVIWESAVEKVLAVAVGLATVVVTYLILRRGVLRPSASLELRWEPDTNSPEVVAVAGGRLIAAAVEHAPNELRVRLPRLDAPSLRLWAHRVTAADDSEPLAVKVVVERDGSPGGAIGQSIELDGDGEAVVPLDDRPVGVVFSRLQAGLSSGARSRP